MIYGMIDAELIEKYIQKYERYADAARDAAEVFRDDAGVVLAGAEAFGANVGEAEAYAHVARDLRAMLNGIIYEN